jgi:hypothetical protein
MVRLLFPLLWCAAIAARGADLSQHFAAQGELILAQLASAPFPHPSRAEGHRYEGQLYSAKEHYADSSVAIFIPKGLRETGKIDFIVHFHGWKNHVQRVLEHYQLIDQLATSGRNAVLVIPQGPYDAPDSGGGKLEDADGFKRFMDEVADTLRQKSGLKKKDFTIGQIIISGHSGGFQVMASILDRGGLTDHIREVWLFDALYARTPQFLAWIDRKQGRFIDIYTEHGGTKGETEKLMATLKSRHVPFLARKESDTNIAELLANRIIFLYSDLPHDEVVHKREAFREYLETSCLEKRVPDPPAGPFVQRIDFAGLAAGAHALSPRDRAVMNLYLDGARRYVLSEEDGAFPAKGSEHFRNIAERAHGAAVLAEIASEWPSELRERCRRKSIEFVKEFTAQFAKEHSFGNTWQSSWWVAEMGATAWFLWDRLDPPLQEAVAEMIVYHADIIAAEKPGARVNLDTEAETVAWNSMIVALAANMMPNHPHADKWRDAVRRYVYTIFATPHDLGDASPADDGRPLKDWIAGANIHDDFSLENHNRFHIDYEFTCYRFLMFGAAMHRLGGNQVPDAFRHHTWDTYEKVLLPCTDGSKFIVYVSDNDWKRYHGWTESPAIHGYVALMHSSSLAAGLEEQSLREADSYWQAFPENFGYANPYVCGKAWTPRIADILLLHLLMPAPPPSVSAAEAEAKLRGAHQKQDVNLLTQYSPEGSFRSFYWGPGPTVRHVEPRDDAWMMLPLTIDYGVAINGKPLPDAGAKVTCRKGGDWFWAVRHDARGIDDAFISLPGEMVIALASAPAAALKGAKTIDSVAAVEKPHKTFTIYYRDGAATFRYGEKAWERSDKAAGRGVDSGWINLGDRMGYEVLNLSQDPAGIILPKPGVRDNLSLHHVEKPVHDQYFVTVVLPNRDHRQTEAMAGQVTGAWHDGVLSCLAPPYFVWANFTDREAHVELPKEVQSAGPISSPARSVGIFRTKDNGKTWSPLE